MFSKRDVLGIRCEIVNHQIISGDEKAVMIADRLFFIQDKNIGCFCHAEKFAVRGESPFYVRADCLIDFAGPNSGNKYLIRLNSRGCCEKHFVNESDLVFMN